MCCKSPLKDELVRFWWSKVMVTMTLPVCWNTASQNLAQTFSLSQRWSRMMVFKAFPVTTEEFIQTMSDITPSFAATLILRSVYWMLAGAPSLHHLVAASSSAVAPDSRFASTCCFILKNKLQQWIEMCIISRFFFLQISGLKFSAKTQQPSVLKPTKPTST